MIPYPAYKSTNLPWLPKIPEHWEIRSIHRICRLQGGSGFPVRYQGCYTESIPFIKVNALASHISTARRYDTVSRETAASLGAKVFSRGDIVFAKVGAALLLHRFEVLPFDCCIDNNMMAMYQISENNQWLKYTLSLLNFNSLVNPGAVPSISQSQIAGMSVPCPPRNEQEQIVRYLDSMTAKINKLIRAKKKQIALLQEQRQAIINRAVTKGLDTNVEMKDSGIDWLGKIPKHWTLLPLKRVCRTNAGISSIIRNYADDSLVSFLPMERISSTGIIDCSEKRLLKDVRNGFTPFARNDVVVAKITPCFENGKGACLDILDTDIGFGTTELIVLRNEKDKAIPMFLYFVTQTSSFRKMGAEVMTGSAGQKRVPADFIANFKCGIPGIDEQERIVHHLTTKTKSIDMLIERIEMEKEFVLEYKNSLISSVVTGQTDVRNIPVEDVIPDDLIPDDESSSEIEEEPITDESEE